MPQSRITGRFRAPLRGPGTTEADHHSGSPGFEASAGSRDGLRVEGDPEVGRSIRALERSVGDHPATDPDLLALTTTLTEWNSPADAAAYDGL